MNVLDILNSPWAITPEKLTEMCAIYAAHRNGDSADLQAIEAALGKPLQPGGPKPYEVQDGVAIIPLEGVLSKRMGLFSQISGGQSYQSFNSELTQALADPQVTAIILSVDSPGGAVDGVQGASDAVYAARSQKPIAAFVDGTMASAAYWIGSAASQVYIGSSTDVVGSIGILTQHIDTAIAEHQRGVKITDITAGKYKAIASQHAPLTADGRNNIQDQLDQVYGVFIDDVARNRGVQPKTVLSKMADGRVFVGDQAIAAGLVDGKMTLPQLIQKMSSQKGASSMGRAPQPVKGKTAVRASDETSNPVEATMIPTSPTVANPVVPAAVEPIPTSSAAEQTVSAQVQETMDPATLRAMLKDAELGEKQARYAVFSAPQGKLNAAEVLLLITAQIAAAETVTSLRTQLRAANHSGSTPEQRITKLRALKEDEISARRLLDAAVPAEKTAQAAVWQCKRTNSTAAALEPYVTAQLRASETVRSLRARLNANNLEQLATLRG